MIIRLVIFILIGSIFYSCTKEIDNRNQEYDSDNFISEQFSLIGKSFDQPKIDLVVSKHMIPIKHYTSSFINSHKVVLENLQSFKIDTKSEKGIFNITTFNLKNNPEPLKSSNKFSVFAEIEDENGITVLFNFIFEKEFRTNELRILDIEYLNYDISKSPKNIYAYEKINDCYGSYSVECIDSNGDGAVSYGESFGACISYALDTDEFLGQSITGLGIAGGAGCVPCGIAAAAVSVFVLIGCAGGCA